MEWSVTKRHFSTEICQKFFRFWTYNLCPKLKKLKKELKTPLFAFFRLTSLEKVNFTRSVCREFMVREKNAIFRVFF